MVIAHFLHYSELIRSSCTFKIFTYMLLWWATNVYNSSCACNGLYIIVYIQLVIPHTLGSAIVLSQNTIIYLYVGSFLESILLLKGSLFTHYITILYGIYMPCVFVIYLYYISKINIIHSFIHIYIYSSYICVLVSIL